MGKEISVIIPCYNVERYIDRCMRSLVNQTIGIDKLELIFVNDASTDRTLEILAKYESQYPEDILVVDLPANVKQGGARNAGLQYASGKYIGFVDSDDWVEVSMYEKLYEKAKEYDCDVIHCRYQRVTDENTPMGITGEEDRLYVIHSLDERRLFFLKGMEGGLWSNLYKKSLIVDNQVFFPEKITYEDNFWLPVLQLYVNRYYIIEEYLYHYFVNMQSTITTKNSMHHFDRLLIELMKIEEYKKRGVLSLFHDEIELTFLKMYFINTLNIMFTRFSDIPDSIFDEMQSTIKKCFPDYQSNRYINTEMNEAEKYMLKLIPMDITKEELEEVAANYRNGYLCIPEK